MNEVKSSWNEFSLACLQLGIEISDDRLEKIISFHEMLLERNKTLNLTRIEDLDEAILKHYLDTVFLLVSLSKRDDLNGIRTVLDLGSGGGIPGVILAILLPGLERLVLVEARNKKLAFLKEVCEHLRLPLEPVHDRWNHSRAKRWVKNFEVMDLVTARAVSEPLNLIRILSPVVGRWLILPRGPADGENVFRECVRESSRLGWSDGERDQLDHRFREMSIQRQIWIWKNKKRHQTTKKDKKG